MLIRHFEPSGTLNLKQSILFPPRRALNSSTVSVKIFKSWSEPENTSSADQPPTETSPFGARLARFLEVCSSCLNVESKSTALSELSEYPLSNEPVTVPPTTAVPAMQFPASFTSPPTAIFPLLAPFPISTFP